VITVLPDSPDVLSVVLGDDGVFANAKSGLIYIDMSTIAPATAVQLAEAGRERGYRVLDAPVSGGERGAIEGTLSIMVGGDENDIAAAQPVFRALGSTIVHVGGSGAGQTVKAANQLLTAGTIELVAEAIVFLEAHDDATTALRALSGGLAGSAVIDRRAPDKLTRKFTPGFSCDLHHKDLGIMMSAARAAGVVVPLGAVAAQLMAALVAQGRGELDNTALLGLVEQEREFTAQPLHAPCERPRPRLLGLHHPARRHHASPVWQRFCWLPIARRAKVMRGPDGV
jgi:2-hydroxy-3-oxopropionate reductase